MADDARNDQEVLVVSMVSVRPENQEKVIDALRGLDAAEPIPGLLSLDVYRSIDGQKLLNEMRWESPEAFQQAHHLPHVSTAISEAEKWVESREADFFQLVHSRR